MPFQINIFNFKINSFNNNSNISLGPSLQNSHTANSKLVGGNFVLGDFSPAKSCSFNKFVDPDISDQGQIENPSSPTSDQT
ncbi:spore germination protein [Neobacillus sp. Marseille-QA0830]